MATAVYINIYNSHVDRGATVSRVPCEHYEVDEEQIKVGQRLPKWPVGRGAPTVTAYDGEQLTLERNGKTFTIKVGEELEVDSSEHEVGMGVYCRTYYYVKLIGTELFYMGDWQYGDTITQELDGPFGNGEVLYPNGDYFKGAFHLSYASINGPAYAADGRYDFADGSWIDRAWIHTSKERKPEYWGLHGVFRVHHPDGPDSIAMFQHGGKHYGFELFLPEKSWQKPWVKEWYDGDEVVRYSGSDELFHYEVEDYEIDEASRVDCTTLRLTLRDGDKVYRIEQQGGRYVANQYDKYIYEPSTRVTVHLPNGDSLDHYGTGVRDFKPYDGYIDVHCAKTGKCRTEHWEKGKLTDDCEWKYDPRAAKSANLPHPFKDDWETKAEVWADGHIRYIGGDIYDGETAYGMPEGKGVLTKTNGGRYEGEFHAGRCHGQGMYFNEQTGIRQQGMWEKGIYQEPNATKENITLHARHGHRRWGASSSGDWRYEESEVEVKVGRLGCFTGFVTLEVARIEKGGLTLTCYDKVQQLTPGKTVSFYAEIEGREWSDGCVYDGDDYSLELSWRI